MSAVAKHHPDPANSATRPACADLNLLTVERMCGVDARTIGGSRSDTMVLCRVRRPNLCRGHPRPVYSRIYRIDLTRDSMRRPKLCTLWIKK
jgi:hypothetical protein